MSAKGVFVARASGAIRRRLYGLLLPMLIATALASYGSAQTLSQVDSVPVTGQTQAVSETDIRDVIATVTPDFGKPIRLEVVSSREIHAYVQPPDLGWITVKRVEFHEPDGSIRPGWEDYLQGIGDNPDVLRLINSANDIYVFPVTTPLAPHRDDKDLRLLSGEARRKLVRLLGEKSNWYIGGWDLLFDNNQPTDVGFVFRNGRDELVLFCSPGEIIEGTLNGERIKGMLNEGPGKRLEMWKKEFAKIELAIK